MNHPTLQITHGLFNHMVVQRGGAAAFGGTCQATGPVRVVVRRGKQIVRSAVVAGVRAGKFVGKLPKVPAGGPYEFEVSINGARLVVRDVLVGDVWLLGGQSNMQGGGQSGDAAKPAAQVRAFYMDDRWAVARDPIHNMWQCVDQVHIDLCGGGRPPQFNGIGPGVTFGLEMRRRTGIPQGLIACAHGGTSMAQWNPALKKEGSRSLYGALVRRLQKNGGRVAGLVWYQGEAEWYAEAVTDYTANMCALVRALRRDAQDAGLPVAIVQIARHVDASPNDAMHWNSIQDQQRRLAKVIRRLTCVPAIDLPLDDPAHISGHGANRLGRRLAGAMDDLRHGRGPLTLSRIAVRRGKAQGNCQVIVQFDNVIGRRLRAAGRPNGFSILNAGLTETVYGVQLDGDRVVLFVQSSPREARSRALTYGAGINPFCNITDAADRSLPVFGPVDLGRQRVLTPFIRSWRVGRIATEPVSLTRPPAVAGAGWKRMNFPADFADCHQILGSMRDGGLLFAVGFNCAEPMRLRAHLGYDGPITAWCDGRQIFRDPKGTNPARADEGMSYQWPAKGGQHELLIYLGANTGKAWGVFLRLERVDVSPKALAHIIPVFS